MLSRRLHGLLGLVALVYTGMLFVLALARFVNVHNQTFDLAMYARIAWGLAHGDFWSSITDTHALGTHISPLLFVLGLLGRVLGTVPVLLAAQALAIGLCVWPIARIGARRMGKPGVWFAVSAWLLYPNLGHVATYEFHPGTLAVLPLCWAYDALDRGKLDALAWCSLGALACREDLGVACLVLALLLYEKRGDKRALALAGGLFVYTIGALWVGAAYAPASHSSMDQHFGPWGGSPFGVLRALFTEPSTVWSHFTARERLLYLPRLLAPLSLFALRAPSLLLPALPYLALNLASVFPTSVEQYSHYLTPAVPSLVVAGIVGASVVKARFVRVLWFGTLFIAHHAFGGLPLSRDFPRSAFQPDSATASAYAVLDAIPEQASVQAPYPLLAHLAERRQVYRAPPPERRTTFVVLDLTHRIRFAQQEDVLRTQEEPAVRSWLARKDHALAAYTPHYALLARGQSPRSGAAVQRYFVREEQPGLVTTAAHSLPVAAQRGAG